MRTRATIVAAVALVGMSGVGACGSSTASQSNQPASPQNTSTAQASKAEPTAEVVWRNVDESFPSVVFVVEVTNPGDEPLTGVTLSEKAVNESGAVVGSNEAVLPTIEPNGTFEYVDQLGVGFKELSGVPDEIQVETRGGVDSRGRVPTLETSEPKIEAIDPVTAAVETSYAYEMTVEVTNDLGVPLQSGVRQQGIVYDSEGEIVGAFAGASDNVPSQVADGESYVEKANVAATDEAASASYAVWQG